jgi:hypothetical protein
MESALSGFSMRSLLGFVEIHTRDHAKSASSVSSSVERLKTWHSDRMQPSGTIRPGRPKNEFAPNKTSRTPQTFYMREQSRIMK